MLVVPEFGAKRILLKHVEVIDPLGCEIALVFDDGAVGSREEGEAAAIGRFRLGDFGRDNGSRFIRYIEWHEADARALLK